MKSILMDRYDGKLPTVLITIIDKEDIAQEPGNSVFLRLKESCISVTLGDSFWHEGYACLMRQDMLFLSSLQAVLCPASF